MQTTTKVKKWGNSLAIRIPLGVAQNLGLAIDSNVQITSDGNIATLKPEKQHKVTLDELLDKVTPENIHSEFDWGKPVGKEIW
jgi:antitoxin MazE